MTTAAANGTSPTIVQIRTRWRSIRITRPDAIANRPLFDAHLEKWTSELRQIKDKVEAWKGSGDARNPSSLLRALREMVIFEAMMFSDLKDAFHQIRRTAVDRRRINVLLDSMSSGEAVRSLHLEEWKQYEETMKTAGNDPSLKARTAQCMEKEIVKLALMGKNLERLRGDLDDIQSAVAFDGGVDGVHF